MYKKPNGAEFMRQTRLVEICLSILLLSGVASSHTQRIDLPRLTVEDPGSWHITAFTSEPGENVILPTLDTANAKFFEIFHSWKIKDQPNNPTVTVMVVPETKGDRLYIDFNNNEDLTDDGPPALFSNDNNAFPFDLIAKDDSKQRVTLQLLRKPAQPDSSLKGYLDDKGNLTRSFAGSYARIRKRPWFTGERGTFYFDDRVSVRRGTMKMGESVYEIALFDVSNNGLYTDDDDLLLVDDNRDGVASNPAEAHLLDEIFALDGTNLEVSNLDKYGKWVELSVTAEQPTLKFLKQQQQDQQQARQSSPAVDTGVVDPAIWNISASSIDGTQIQLSKYKGKHLLLNFWGEWCLPCIAEIPALVVADKQYNGEKLQIISFLQSNNLKKAKQIIETKGMTWPQLLLTEELKTFFNMYTFPTNILILPDGKKYVKANGVNAAFFDSALR